MELETETIEGRAIISSYTSEGVVVGGEQFKESFILTPHAKPTLWDIDQL